MKDAKIKLVVFGVSLVAGSAFGLLNGISPVLNGEMLMVMNDMGHGEEIIIADANFPAASVCQKVIRADGVKAAELLSGIKPLFELDTYSIPVVMMSPVSGDNLDPRVEKEYRAALGYTNVIERLSREEFYVRAKNAQAVIVTGETAKYGNVILKKGVVCPGPSKQTRDMEL